MFYSFTKNNYDFVLKYSHNLQLMNATDSLEHDKSSFSKILLSKEVADIIKQVIKESTPIIGPKCNDREKTLFKKLSHVKNN